MKKIKYGRQIGYGLAGLAIGIIVYIMLVVDIPAAVEARSLLIEFTDEEESSEYVLNNESYHGEVVPFLKYGSYHVSSSEFNQYELDKTIRFGKVNPTFYYAKKKVTKKKENKKSEETKKDEQATNNTQLTNNNVNVIGGGNFLEGFNIHSREVESKDVTNIRKAFQEQAQLPLDIKYLNVSSGFGVRTDPLTNQSAYHVGVDFATEDIEGAEIRAVLDGKVVEVDKNYGSDGLGNYIVVDHDGFQTLYAHMKDAPVYKVGDTVKKRDVLGNVGTTGRSTGPHLHFEVGIDGLKFNGLEFLLHVIDTNNDGKVSTDELGKFGFNEVDSSHWLYNYMTTK